MSKRQQTKQKREDVFSVIIYASVWQRWRTGLGGVAEAPIAGFAWVVGFVAAAAAASTFSASRTDTESSRAEGGGDEERDGREQLRDVQLRSPEMFGPFSGREEQLDRRRGIEMDSTKRRGNVFFNDQADAVPGSEIIPVQTEPSWPRARLR